MSYNFLKLFCFSVFLLSLTTIDSYGLTKSQQSFVDDILKNLGVVNIEIQENKLHLDKLHKEFTDNKSFDQEDSAWLSQTASHYKISYDFTNPNFWNVFEKRVDVIPPSLVLAQAIYESNWGNSRFAREGNNYFGQYCFKKGCGLIPNKRSENSTFEVKRFENMQKSIRSYVHNINTNKAYKTLRELRYEQNKFNGFALSTELKNYAEQTHYVKSIQSIIKKYELSKYDI